MSQKTVLGRFLIFFGFRREIKHVDALSKPELLRLLTAARAHSERDFLMILMAYCHGLRASEVIAIKRDHIKGDCLDVRRQKKSLRTNQPLVRHENPLLDERTAVFGFLGKSNGNQRLFPITRRQFGRIVQRHAETAGLPEHKRHPHMLKHTMGTEIYEKTKDLRLVKSYLGHARESSSLIYAGRFEEQQATTKVQTLLNS